MGLFTFFLFICFVCNRSISNIEGAVRQGIDLSECGTCKTQGRDEGHVHSNILSSNHASSSERHETSVLGLLLYVVEHLRTGSRTKTTDTIQIWHTICIRYISVKSSVDQFPPCALPLQLSLTGHSTNRTLRAQQQVISPKPFTRAI